MSIFLKYWAFSQATFLEVDIWGGDGLLGDAGCPARKANPREAPRPRDEICVFVQKAPFRSPITVFLNGKLLV